MILETKHSRMTKAITTGQRFTYCGTYDAPFSSTHDALFFLYHTGTDPEQESYAPEERTYIKRTTKRGGGKKEREKTKK